MGGSFFIFDDDVYPLHSHLHPIYRAILVEGTFLLPSPIRKKGERRFATSPLQTKQTVLVLHWQDIIQALHIGRC